MLTVARYGTRDIARAKTFYDAVTRPLGASCVTDRPELIGYKGSEGGMFLVGRPLEGEPSVGNGSQVGFAAPSREAVHAAHAAAIEQGGRDEGAPGIRGDDPDGFYGAYFRDLDGNKIVVFRFGPA
jgi:catechol 2,3-dioxygenase-like lactoylglutathione lyase family enzyme